MASFTMVAVVTNSIRYPPQGPDDSTPACTACSFRLLTAAEVSQAMLLQSDICVRWTSKSATLMRYTTFTPKPENHTLCLPKRSNLKLSTVRWSVSDCTYQNREYIKRITCTNIFIIKNDNQWQENTCRNFIRKFMISQEMSWAVRSVWNKNNHKWTATWHPTLHPLQDQGTGTCQTASAVPRCRPVSRREATRQIRAWWSPRATVDPAKVVTTIAHIGPSQRLIWIPLTTAVYREDSDVAAEGMTGEKQEYISVSLTDTPRKEQTFQSSKFVHKHWANKLIEHKDLISPCQTYHGATFFHILKSTISAECNYELILSSSKQHWNTING